MLNFFLSRRLNCDIFHLIAVGIHGAIGKWLGANWLEHRFIHFASFRIGPSRRCKTVDDKVYLSEILFNLRDRLLLNFIRKCVAINTFSIQARLVSRLFKRHGVVPTRAGRLTIGGGTFKEYTKSRGIIAKRSCNPRGQAVAC